MSCLLGSPHEVPQTIQVIDSAVGCPPGVDGKTLLMKPNALVAGHRKIKLAVSWKLPSCWIAFIVPHRYHVGR